jgi:hypothetical protein
MFKNIRRWLLLVAFVSSTWCAVAFACDHLWPAKGCHYAPARNLCEGRPIGQCPGSPPALGVDLADYYWQDWEYQENKNLVQIGENECYWYYTCSWDITQNPATCKGTIWPNENQPGPQGVYSYTTCAGGS